MNYLALYAVLVTLALVYSVFKHLQKQDAWDAMEMEITNLRFAAKLMRDTQVMTQIEEKTAHYQGDIKPMYQVTDAE